MKKLFTALFSLLMLAATAWGATVNITYRYVHNGNVWYTETKQATVGEAYPELHALPLGVNYTTIPWGNVSSAETIDINCELTDEFLSPYISETYASANWCFLSIRNTAKHLRYENGKAYITATTTSRPSSSETSYQWAFVGNPFTGYKIYNKSAGSSSIMTSPAITGDGGSTTPFMSTEANINTSTHNLFWKLIKEEKSQAILISRWNEDIYMSNYGGGDQMKFWTSIDAGSEFYITPVDQTLSNQSLDTSKQYMLINRTTGKAMTERTLLSYWNNDISYNVVFSTEESDANASALWTLVSNNGGYSLKNYASNRYLTSESESLTPSVSLGNYGYYPPALLKTNTTPTQFYLSNADNGYYFLTTSTATGAEEKIAVGMDDGGAPLMGTVFLTAAQWELREVTPTSIGYASSVTSGKYYRLINNLYPNYSMTETGGKVACMTTSNSETAYSQLWKITKSGTSYTLQNALTGKYIQTNPGTSTQFSTGSTSRNFTGGSVTSNGNTLFYFYTTSTSSNTSLHCNSSYKVVGWAATADASRWLLQEVTVNASDLAAAQTEYNSTTNYTNTLSTFFSDKACTTLNSTYQNYSDANLRTAMANAGLPRVLQEMGVSVRNNTWNTSEGAVWNHYEKDFRIHDYEIYSSNTQWKQLLNTGPFAALTNPTGIQVKAGDVVYIMVGSNVKDSNASLAAALVQGTNQTATTSQTLTQGCNKFAASGDGEIFINYTLNNTSSLYTSYPNITIHIEGGTCNGFFDMHRGHNNNDWAWLKENMFKNKYLHVKGNSVLLNVLYEGVKLETNAVGVMNIWDFIFDTEESFSGCDQYKAAGRYKMMINNFHNENGGNPYWSSAGYGTSHPNLTYTGVFNYNNLANGALWEVAHEIGHAHQAPIKWAGSDEVSNNVMSQIIQFLPKDNIGTNMFQSAQATRSDGVKLMTELFNEGWSFVDYARRRMIVYNDKNSTSLNDNLANRWLFQLWMYFDYLGNYQPTGGNNGFAFVSALHDKLRNSALGTDQVVTPANDYLKLAQYCAEITQTDLSEFFEAWGFWKTTPKNTGYTIIDENNTTSYTDNGSTYYVGGYTIRGLNMSSAASQVNTVRNAMKSYTKKGGHIMFIEDRGVGCTLSQTTDGLNPQTLGDHGYYEDYSKTITGTYKYDVDTSTNTITMSGGENAVGFKIYDNSGNLVAISNMDTFSVPAAVATGLENGTYTLKVAQGDGTDIVATGEDTEPAQPTEQALYCIQSWRSYGFVKYNSDSEGITQTLDFSDANTKFYFLPVNGTNWEDGVKIVSNVSGKQLVDVGTGFANSGTTWYIKENPYKAGFYCISKTSDLSSGCWDCNASGAMTAAYWHPSASDNDGTSWQIVSADSLPQFQTSTLAEPKWYYIQSGRDNRYLYANGTSAGTSTSNAKTDAYKFAFIATANNGIQVISKAGLDQGSNQYLTTDPGLSSTAATWYYYNAAQSNGYFMLAIEELEQNGYAKDYFGYLIGSTWAQRLLHVDASGNLTKWNGSGVGNLYKVEEVPEDAFEVTYNLMVNGNIVATGTQIHSVGDQPSMPAGMNYDFTTFTFNVSEITASTRTVQATATFNMPFETSTNYATAKWYYMNGHASYSDRYISTDGDATVYSQGKGITDAYQWAFIGNPIDGIKVINKAAGDGKYLQGTNPATMGTTAMTWVLKQQTNTNWQCGANGFGLYDATLTYLNTQGTTLKYWGSFDQGSTFWVEEVPDVVVDVTYNLVENGTTVKTIVVENVAGNSAVEIPSSLISDYSTLGYEFVTSGSIGTTNSTITVTPTLKAGVVADLSNLSNNKAYTLTTERGALYIKSDHLASNFNANSGATAGNFALINYEGDYYLYSVDESKFVNADGTLSATASSGMAVLNITAQSTKPLFLMLLGTNGLNVTDTSDDYELVINSWVTADAGNQYCIVEASAFDATAALASLEETFGNAYDNVVAEILPYIFADPTDIANSEPESSIGTPFGITASGAADIVSTYQSQLSARHFTIAEYRAAKALLEANILYPEDGKTYLVKNTYNNKYLRVAEHATRGQVFADLTYEEAVQDASAHIEVAYTDNKPYMLSEGNYFNWVYTDYSGYEAWTSASLDKYAHFVCVGPGVGAFSIALGNGEGNYASDLNKGFYALLNGTTTVAGSTTDYTNQYAQWIFEEFTSIEGDLNGDTHVDIVDLNILIGIIFGTNNPADYNNADLNGDNTYSVGDVTRLVNLIRQQSGN